MAMKDELRQQLLEKKSNSEEESLRKKVWDESKKIWVVAGPAIFTRFSSFGMNVITQAFVGHIGSTELAAYALVSTVLTRFVIGILVSLSVSYYNGLF
jgi:MATE family multidrug resistance protein